MISLTITEKLWDGVRPGSVKKTGLSEAIREFNKIATGKLDTPKAYDGLRDALGDLEKVLDKAAEAVKKAKDDKKGAAAKLKTWQGDCEKAKKQLVEERTQLGILKAAANADAKLKDVAKEVEEAITATDDLINDIKSGKLTDMKKAAQGLQQARNAVRDGLSATHKDGFVKFIATIEQVLAWQVNPADVPMPPNGKDIKARLPVLEDKAEKARIAVEGLLHASANDRPKDVNEIAKDLVKGYRELTKTLKGYVPVAKKFGTDVAAAGDLFKQKISAGFTYDKLLPLVAKLHDKIMEFDEKTMKEIARGRIASGDLQAERIEIRDNLKKVDMKMFQEFEKVAGDEWNFCMAVYREISEKIGQAHTQVTRVLRLLGDSSEEAKSATEGLATTYDSAVKSLRGKYM